QGLCRSRIFMQIVIQRLLYEIVDERTYGWTVRSDVLRTEFCFRLRLEYRLLHFNGNGANNGGAYIGCIKFFFIKFAYGLNDRFTESRLVCTTLCGMLSIDKRIVFLAILLSMGQRYFNILSLQVDNTITHRLRINIALQQVL